MPVTDSDMINTRRLCASVWSSDMIYVLYYLKQRGRGTQSLRVVLTLKLEQSHVETLST